MLEAKQIYTIYRYEDVEQKLVNTRSNRARCFHTSTAVRLTQGGVVSIRGSLEAEAQVHEAVRKFH